MKLIPANHNIVSFAAVIREKRCVTSLITAAEETNHNITIDHFTVVCSVTWPQNGSESGVDLVLILTSLLLLCKTSCSDAN